MKNTATRKHYIRATTVIGSYSIFDTFQYFKKDKCSLFEKGCTEFIRAYYGASFETVKDNPRRGYILDNDGKRLFEIRID